MSAPAMSVAPVSSQRLLDFELPPELEASEPPEARGIERDQVRLMATWRHRGHVEHTVFRDLPAQLGAGDLLVVNTSATLPAAVAATGPDGSDLELHLSTRLPGELWVVEVRRAAQPASAPFTGAWPGMTVGLPGGGRADLLAASGTPGRLWVAALQLPEPLALWLARHGRPIRYRHVPVDWPLACYQTVFGHDRGSAEMPSAGRPFTTALVTELVSRGVAIAPLTLHSGVSSLELHEAPPAEWYRVPAATADIVNRTHLRGNRVVAVGTTVVRALETVADGGGQVHPGVGWTELVITPEGGVRAVDGIITGWHEPAASHLALLEAIAGRDLLERSYREALSAGYRWHEFGDSHLILP
jgi:S-adenosylmethionine:tRNA ribosyltransferase-isomerase